MKLFLAALAAVALTVTSAAAATTSNGNGNRYLCLTPEIDSYVQYNASGAPYQTQVIVYCGSVRPTTGSAVAR